MTAATSTAPHVEFQQQLPAHVQRSLQMSQVDVALVHAAVRNHGWTPKALAAECGRDLEGVVNAGARVEERLRKAATHPPTNQPTARTQRVHQAGCDGWIYTTPADPADPIGTTRCHGCTEENTT